MLRREDGQHRGEGLAFAVGPGDGLVDHSGDGVERGAQYALAGALAERRTDLIAACTMFSAQPNVCASRASRRGAPLCTAASA